MEGRLLTADAFIALVTSHVREYGCRQGLGSVEPAGPGFWLVNSSYARLLRWIDGGITLLLHRVGDEFDSKILRSVQPTVEEARDVAERIVAHLAGQPQKTT